MNILNNLNGLQDRTTQDTFEANFEDWSRLFSTPNQQADPTFQTPVATGRPGREGLQSDTPTLQTTSTLSVKEVDMAGVAGVVRRCF